MWSSSVSKWNDFRHGGGGWMAHAHALFFRSLFLFLLFSIVCHPYINYIGVANMIKHTRAIDREVEAAATTTTKSHFNTICFVWFFMICFGVQFLLRPIITTRKCVLCNVDFTHSRESAATSRILFLLPQEQMDWARAVIMSSYTIEWIGDFVWLSMCGTVLLCLFYMAIFCFSHWFRRVHGESLCCNEQFAYRSTTTATCARQRTREIGEKG